MIGVAAGLDLRKVGDDGRSAGRSVSAALIAAWTSRAAPSMLRARSNWMVTRVLPNELREVSSVTPAISPSRRSSGAATVAAIVSGSAPGRLAVTLMVGKSTVGMLATGRNRYATMPTSSSPMASSVVPTGRRMKGSEKFARLMRLLRRPLRRFGLIGEVELGLHRPRAAEARPQALHREIDDRGRVEREQLAEQQPADDGDAERVAQLRAGAAFERQRNGAEQGRQRRHH